VRKADFVMAANKESTMIKYKSISHPALIAHAFVSALISE
jgi:hypothetical protein